ncbi:MAG: hypothetical protein LBQ57_07620, partial [Spirochaetales bacterium]|nr:hypothetical protein [Spirochaetales bacterium]
MNARPGKRTEKPCARENRQNGPAYTKALAVISPQPAFRQAVRRPLTIARIAGVNLKSVFFRTACLGLFVALLAFTLFGGGLVSKSLENGAANLS